MKLTTLAPALAYRFGLAYLLFSQTVILAQPYVISTIAGGAPPPTPLSAVTASISFPSGIAADNSGNIYFSSDNSVFKIDATGTLTRVAGNSRAGFSGDGAAATNAQLDTPYGVAVDSSGNIYIGDGGNNRIRKVTPNGIISTVAGTGVAGYSGDAGPALNAQLDNPLGVAVDSSGNLYIADSYNKRIRKVLPSGVISTIAGDGTCCFSGDNGPAAKAQLYQPEGVAVDSSGNIYIADVGSDRVRKITAAGIITTVVGTGAVGFAGDGGPATAAQLEIAWGVAVDSSGNLYVADSSRIRKVLPSGTINTVAGLQTSGFSGDGAAATKAQLDAPVAMATDAAGNLYIADTGNNRIRKVLPGGNIATIAGDGTHNYSGDGGAAINAQLYDPQSVALNADGSYYIAEYARVRKVASNGVISTVAGNGALGYFGDNGAAASAQLNQPEGLALDNNGNLYIADSANNRVRKVTPSGVISTVAGAGNPGYSGDGTSATSALLRDPEAVAMDAAGNLYIADSGNSVIRKVAANGIITTIAGNGTQGFAGDGASATTAQLSFPRGIALDSKGNFYIADFGNGRIRQVSSGGIITTIAGRGAGDASGDGGPATSAGLSPQGVAVDASGNLYIADLNNLVWKVSQGGTILRIAGNGTPGYSGDGGSAINAQTTDIHNVAVDSAGNVYLADSSNYAIRLLRPVTVLLAITTSNPLAPASINAPYSQTLAATGGTLPLTWTLTGGTLPVGLTLSASGVISGTPTVAGTSSFTVQVTDALSSIATQAFSLSASAPAITTISPLLQGTVGLTYSQTLSATGGASPYVWTLASGALPPGLALSPAGVISGTPTSAATSNFSVKLTDAASNVATQAFTIVIIAAPPLTRSGVFAHIAAGGPWTTTIYLANTTTNQVAVTLTLYADDGTALNLPMTVTQQGASQSLTSTQLNTVISPNSTLLVDTGQQLAGVVTGWVDVLSSGPLSGFAIFRTSANGTSSEGTSPLQTQFQAKIDIPYDNRSDFVSAVAIANLSTNPATITATIWDSTGAQLAVQSIALPPAGHTSFLFPTQFPSTAGLQGIVQFQSSAGSLAAVGLRVSPTGSFTSIPIIEP